MTPPSPLRLVELPDRSPNRREVEGWGVKGRLVRDALLADGRPKHYLLMSEQSGQGFIDHPHELALCKEWYAKPGLNRAISRVLEEAKRSRSAGEPKVALVVGKDGPVPVYVPGRPALRTLWRGLPTDVEVAIHLFDGPHEPPLHRFTKQRKHLLEACLDDLGLEFRDLRNRGHLEVVRIGQRILNRMDRHLCRTLAADAAFPEGVLSLAILRFAICETFARLGVGAKLSDRAWNDAAAVATRWGVPHGELSDVLGPLGLLWECAWDYRNHDSRNADVAGIPPGWMRDVAEHLRFLGMVRSRWHRPSYRPRAFLARPHQSASAAFFHHELLNRFTVHTGGGADVENQAEVFVSENAGLNPKIRAEVKAALWQCDVVIVYFAKRDQHDPDKTYAWLAAEMDHALLLGKPVYIYVEEGVSEDGIRRDLEILEEVLEPEARCWEHRGARAARLVEVFDTTARQSVDPALHGFDLRLDEIHEEVRRIRHETLVRATLEPFSNPLKWLVKEQTARPDGTPMAHKEAICGLRKFFPTQFRNLAEAARGLRLAAEEAADWSVSLEGIAAEEIGLLEYRDGLVSANLRGLVESIRPDLDSGEVVERARQCLKWC